MKRILALLVFFFSYNSVWAADLGKVISVQQAQIAKLIKENEAFKLSVNQQLQSCRDSNSKQQWTEGSMCVLANGTCPAGFQRSEGYMRAIGIFQDNANAPFYLSPANFGSSRIQWHGAPYQYGSWAGELHLVACCK